MMPRVSDRELKKWLGILGVQQIKKLYIDSKIYLTSKQVDYVIEYENAKRDNDKNSKFNRTTIK